MDREREGPREAAADALRRLGHAFVSHDLEAADLDGVRAQAEALLALIEAKPERTRSVDELKWAAFNIPDREGALLSHFPECVVSGRSNPMGIAMVPRREGQTAVSTVRLGAAFEGAPGRAHGGVVAAIFDDTMGYVINLLRRPAFTAWLRVNYLAPTPMGVEVTFRAWLVEADGRKLTLAGEALDGEQVIATAEALFIAIPLERLGFPAPPGG